MSLVSQIKQNIASEYKLKDLQVLVENSYHIYVLENIYDKDNLYLVNLLFNEGEPEIIRKYNKHMHKNNAPVNLLNDIPIIEVSEQHKNEDNLSNIFVNMIEQYNKNLFLDDETYGDEEIRKYDEARENLVSIANSSTNTRKQYYNYIITEMDKYKQEYESI